MIKVSNLYTKDAFFDINILLIPNERPSYGIALPSWSSLATRKYQKQVLH